MLTLRTHRSDSDICFMLFLNEKKKIKIIYWGRVFRSPQRWRGHIQKQTNTHTRDWKKMAKGKRRQRWWLSKVKNRGSEPLTCYGSGAFCNLMEWCDRVVMRWYFIRIPRNLNYVFTAIKMKYYKFNNRAVSSTVWSFSSTWSIFRCFLLCCCCGFSGLLCVADLVPKSARSPTEHTHTHDTHHIIVRFHRIHGNPLCASFPAHKISDFWISAKTAAAAAAREWIYYTFVDRVECWATHGEIRIN